MRSPAVMVPRIKNLWWTPRTPASQRTQCPKGHPYDEANTYRRQKGTGAQGQPLFQRYCKLCLNAKWHRYYVAHPAKFRRYKQAQRRRTREKLQAERRETRVQRLLARERGELWAYLP